MAFEIRFPAVYERISAPRTDEEIERELNRRCGYVECEARQIPLDQAAPAPEEQIVRPSKFIRAQPGKRPVPGLKGACGRNAAARAKKASA